MKQIAVWIFLALSVCAFGQTTGGSFHEVEAGETKYGISKLYGISIETLEKFNPDIKEGLKEGMKLYIPKVENPEPIVDNQLNTDTSKYILYTVKQGETMFSISQNFGISYAQIKALNPNTNDGLRLGEVLKLPKQNIAQVGTPVRDSSYVYHVVQAGETAYSLSKKYKISLDSLYLLNPHVKDVLKIGDELKFLQKRKNVKRIKEGLNSDKQIEKPLKEGEYFLYQVKTGDTYYSFKKKFKVNRAELIELNPELKTNGLEVGRYIILPKSEEGEDAVWLDQLFSEVEGVEGEEKEVEYEEDREESLYAKNKINLDTIKVDFTKRYRVGVMLPFFAPTSVDTSFNYDVEVEKRSMVALEFYNGFLLAVDSLSKAGMNITLDVVDTRNSKVTVESKITDFKFSRPDMIVGPLFKDHVERVAEAFKTLETPVISPLSNMVDVTGKPNLVKCINSEDAFANEVAEILNRKTSPRNVIFAHTGEQRELEKLKQIKARIKAVGGNVSFDELVGTEDRKYVVGYSNTRAALQTGKANILVALSDNEVFLADLVNQLYSTRDTSIEFIASPKVMKINALEYKYLNALHLHMPDGNFIDTDLATTQAFEATYEQKYRSIPTKFAYQGYDVGMYFLSQLWQYGRYFNQSLYMSKVGVSTGFEFVKNEQGGYENIFMFTTALKDYKLSRAK